MMLWIERPNLRKFGEITASPVLVEKWSSRRVFPRFFLPLFQAFQFFFGEGRLIK
jgi:hypothetical protein